jgi:hypothetical protein
MVPPTLPKHRVLGNQQRCHTLSFMKVMTVRLPDARVAEIEAESRARNVSKSDVVRDRIERASKPKGASPLADIADLIGAIDHGPPDLSARKKHYLRVRGYGRNRNR